MYISNHTQNIFQEKGLEDSWLHKARHNLMNKLHIIYGLNLNNVRGLDLGTHQDTQKNNKKKFEVKKKGLQASEFE